VRRSSKLDAQIIDAGVRDRVEGFSERVNHLVNDNSLSLDKRYMFLADLHRASSGRTGRHADRNVKHMQDPSIPAGFLLRESLVLRILTVV